MTGRFGVEGLDCLNFKILGPHIDTSGTKPRISRWYVRRNINHTVKYQSISVSDSLPSSPGVERRSRANVPVHFHRFPAAVPPVWLWAPPSTILFTADDANSEGLNWGGVNLRHALPPGEAHGGQVKRSSWGFGASWRQHIVSARSLVKLAVAMNPVWLL